MRNSSGSRGRSDLTRHSSPAPGVSRGAPVRPVAEVPVGDQQPVLLQPRVQLPRQRLLPQSGRSPVLTCTAGTGGQGVTDALLGAAVHVTTAARAPALEGYPADTDVPGHTRNAFTGTAAVFTR